MRMLFSLVLLAGPALAQLSFTDQTVQAGIDFVHVGGGKDKGFILEAHGSGAAFFDADADGDLDLYMVNGSTFSSYGQGSGNVYYRNDGGRFIDDTAHAGLGDRRWGAGVAVGDVDGDGLRDLYLTNYGANALFLNSASGQFVETASGVEGGDGSSLTVNIPTVGRIPGGASVERMIDTPFLTDENIMLNLHQGDFSTTTKVSEAINTVFGDGVAIPLDSTTVKVRAPMDPAQKVSFVSLLENIEVEPDRPRAKVVINARTGTIVIGGDVRVSPAAVTHGSLTVRVEEDVNVTQTQTAAIANGVAAIADGAAVANPETQITATEEQARAFVFDPGVELSAIVDALNAVGGSPSDLVAILEALREAGSLRAELIVI